MGAQFGSALSRVDILDPHLGSTMRSACEVQFGSALSRIEILTPNLWFGVWARRAVGIGVRGLGLPDFKPCNYLEQS